jgi:colanic acid/amylovoran biosynthesis protein
MTTKKNLPRNIIVSHVYSSDNKGDAALTSVLIQDLKRVFPKAKLTILRLEAIDKDSVFEGVPEKPSFMYYALNCYRNPLLKLSYTLYMMLATLFWAYCKRWTGKNIPLPAHLAAVAHIYEDCDLIVPVGGGYIRSRKGWVNRFNIPLLLHPLWLGHILGKPTVLYAQSMGPFQNAFEKMLVAYVLRQMTLILLREDTSVKLLASMGVSKNVERAIDSGFLLESARDIDIRTVHHIPKNKLLIGVTVRSWLSGKAQENYEKSVAEALDMLIETAEAHVVFIPQVTATKGDDDRITSSRVHGLMQHTEATTLIDDEPDHHHIKAIYDKLDILLGTRFHSVIFSLTSYVPVVAIEYEHKTSGIMHDLKLDPWVIPIEAVTAPKLQELLKKLVKERNSYKKGLQKRLPPYVLQASEAATMLANAYYMATNTSAKQ